MINNTDMVLNLGLMVPNTRDSTLKARKRATVNLPLPMDPNTKVNSVRMRYVVEEDILGLMASSMRENGLITKCTDKENLYGEIEKNT